MYLLLKKDPEDWEIADVSAFGFHDLGAAEDRQREIRKFPTPNWLPWETRIIEVGGEPEADHLEIAFGWPKGEPFLDGVVAGRLQDIDTSELEWREDRIRLEDLPSDAPTPDL